MEISIYNANGHFNKVINRSIKTCIVVLLQITDLSLTHFQSDFSKISSNINISLVNRK